VFSGVTMLGDGLPAPILDVLELSSRTVHLANATTVRRDASSGAATGCSSPRRPGRRVVIPLES
jgi:chemotaxis protein histidine kinase CheA